MADAKPLVRRTEHAGITVSSIDEALKFWVDTLGFELLSRRDLGGGPAMENVLGVPGAHLSNAMRQTPDGAKLELLEFSAPDDRTTLKQRVCDVGAGHVAVAVHDLEETLSRIEPMGWPRQGTPQVLPSGARVVYVRGPEGHMLELIQPPS